MLNTYYIILLKYIVETEYHFDRTPVTNTDRFSLFGLPMAVPQDDLKEKHPSKLSKLITLKLLIKYGTRFF